MGSRLNLVDYRKGMDEEVRRSPPARSWRGTWHVWMWGGVWRCHKGPGVDTDRAGPRRSLECGYSAEEEGGTRPEHRMWDPRKT